MRDPDYMKTNRHLFVSVYLEGKQVGNSCPIADPFINTTMTISFTVWELVKLIFSRKRETVVRIAVDGDSVAMKRWFQGQDTCERCQQVKIGPLPGVNETNPGYHHGSERWCRECYYSEPIKPTAG